MTEKRKCGICGRYKLLTTSFTPKPNGLYGWTCLDCQTVRATERAARKQNTDTRECLTCGKVKSVSEFPVETGYVRYQCKVCRNKVKRESKTKTTAKAKPIKAQPVYTYRHPWESLGEDWRPDWASDKRSIPVRQDNQNFYI